MRVAIYGKRFSEGFNDAIYKLFEKLNKKQSEIFVYQPFYEFIKEQLFYEPRISGVFTKASGIAKDTNLLFSIGGDGTFLECVALVKNSGIPIVGINSGRMGFLAYISKEGLNKAIEAILAKEFTLEKRTLIQLESSNSMFGDFNYALNELTVHKKDTGSMINVHVFMNNEFLNTYWADGLIISTPTGSTAYSLSTGGPIVAPDSGNFIITPIAPHNLTVRPIVVSDTNEIKLRVEGRSPNFLASLDYKSEVFDSSVELIVRKADFTINMIKLDGSSFFQTLRTKLMWGIDKRSSH